MRNSIHIAILCLVSLFAAGCDKSVTDAPADEKDVWVNLNIGIALSDSAVPERSSRADVHEKPADEAEKMQTLRIVVVDKDGNVEANRFLYAGSVVEYGEEHFKVRANETKQVYVFVNEKNKSVKVYDAAGDCVDDFHAYLGDIEVGEPFPRTEIEGLEVRLNSAGSELDAAGGGYEKAEGGLPMSTCETVEVGDTDLSHKIYLHRAAVKFTFNITNKSGRDRVLTGLSIDKMAYREYYLPRVDEYKYVDGKPIEIVDFDTPSPEGTNNGYYTFEKSFGDGGITLPNGETVTTSPVYLLEGKYEPEKTDADEKNYSMSISVNGAATGYEYFSNLDRLPRNTHVVVNIVFGVSGVTWTVDLRPYGEVKLDPDFGLDRD